MHSSVTNSNQPDLRPAIVDALRHLGDTSTEQMQDAHPSAQHRLSRLPALNEITIRCQRTWRDIRGLSPVLNEGSFSAAMAQFEQYDSTWSFFIEAVKRAGANEWRVASFSGGHIPQSRKDTHGGCMISGRSHLCIGGLKQVPDGGKIRVTLADGSTFEDLAVDGGCIVFAPVATPPGPDDHATIQYFHPDGSEISARRLLMGDGRPPRTQ